MGKFRAELICELINVMMNVVLFGEPGAVCACLGEGQRVWLGSVSPSMRFVSQQHCQGCFTVFKCLLKKNKKLKIAVMNLGPQAELSIKGEDTAAEVGVSHGNESPATPRDQIWPREQLFH